MPFIRFGDKEVTITPGSAEDILEQLKDQLNAKIDGAALNAVVSTLQQERKDGDEDTLERSVVTVEEIDDPDHSLCYAIKQDGEVRGEIHINGIVKEAEIVTKEGRKYLVIYFEGTAQPLEIPVDDLVDVYTGSTGQMIDITISDDNVISATIKDSSITRAKVAADIEESLQKADDAKDYTDEQVAAEKERAVATEDGLRSQIEAEEDRAIAAEADLQSAIDAEAEERASKDEELQVAITSEVERATNKEEEIATNLANEVTRATGREDDLQAAIEAEESRATGKETELEAAIAQEVTDRENADAAEVEARIAEIARVEGLLGDEVARAEIRETEIEEALEEETANRTSEDKALSDRIEAVEAAYKAADEELETNLKNWVDGKKYATVAQLNATEATHQADITRLDTKDAEQDSRMDDIEEASEVTISETAGTGSVLKTYTFTQNNKEIGKINLAKDLVVTGGSVVEVEGEKYLRLTIANQEQPVDIKVTDLVDVYTSDSEYITISEANQISVSESVKSNLQKASTALQEDALTPYRTSAEQDLIDSEKADRATTYSKEEVDALLEEAGKVQDVKVNGESVLEGKNAIITLKTVGGTALTGEGDIAVSAMSVVEVLPETPSETTLYKLTKDITHQEPKIVIDPTTGEEIEVMVTIVDFAKGLYVWIDGAWKSVLADSTAVNYETLINKPRINGKILTGNKSAADLGLMTEDKLADYQTKEDEGLETTANTIVGAINELKSATSTVYKYKGSVTTVDDLPTRATIGDSYYVESEQGTYAYNGEAFLSIGGTADLSAYQKKTDSTLKTTNKTVSGAINEVRTTAQTNKGAIEEMQTLIGEAPLETEAQTITEAINEIAQGGGTGGSGKMTLNGEEVSVTPENVNIYAPLAAGEKSRMLTGNPLGAPTWETSCRSVTLTKAEYDALTTDKKNNPNIIYYITDDVAGTTDDPAIRWSETLKSSYTSATDKQVYTAKAVNDFISDIKSEVFNTIYPIGSYAFGSKPTMGTWTQVTGDRALWLKNTVADGTTISQGLPNIKGELIIERLGAQSANTQTIDGALYKGTNTKGVGAGYDNSFKAFDLCFDASKSNSIYGATTNVQPNAYVLTVWKRTA